MTYPEALRYLDSFVNYEKKDNYNYKEALNLNRIKALASLLGEPQKDIKSIHIAGSKGKGSTAAIIHSVLKNSGFKTGLYTSPHLVSFRERIRIDDSMISEDDVARLMEKVRQAVNSLSLAADRPTLFEAYTALSYLYFRENHVDFAVYETGLGGRLDATNIVEPLVSVITPISYEHMDKLGNTLGEIALEKAGIIKSNSICVSAPQEEEALKAIRDVCLAKKARLILVGRDISYQELGADETKEAFSVWGLFGEYPDMSMRLLGPHQVTNAATAIGAIEALRLRGIAISPDAIRHGIGNADWPGRLEIAARRPYIVLDGAQNRASAHVLAEAVKKIFKFKKLVLVLGVSKDKDIKGVLDELVPISDSIVLTKSKVIERASEPSEIKMLMDGVKQDITLTSSVEEAIEKASANIGPDGLILVTGSLFVVGEARDILVKGLKEVKSEIRISKSETIPKS